MENVSLNMFDLVVFGVIGLSAMLSFFRGFLREFLSLGAWVGATIITLYAFPHAAELMKPHVKSESVASGFGAMATFMVSLLAISIFTSVILRYAKSSSEVGLLDNGLGLLFGVARGAMLVSLAWFVMSITVKKSEYPEWTKHAFTRPYVEEGAHLLASVAPDYFDKLVTPEEHTPELDKTIGKDDSDKTKWPSMDELQNRMHEESGK